MSNALVFRVSLDTGGHPEQAGLKMARISNIGDDFYVMGIRPQMELEIAVIGTTCT